MLRANEARNMDEQMNLQRIMLVFGATEEVLHNLRVIKLDGEGVASENEFGEWGWRFVGA